MKKVNKLISKTLWFKMVKRSHIQLQFFHGVVLFAFFMHLSDLEPCLVVALL